MLRRGVVLYREGGREKPEAGRKRKVYDVSGQGGQNLSEVAALEILLVLS